MADRKRPRPGTITAVMWTQHLTAVSVILAALGFLIVKETVRTEAERQILNHPGLRSDSDVVASEIGWIIRASFEAMAGFYVILALIYVALGLLNRRDDRTGRVLTWYLAGFGLFCCTPASLLSRLTAIGTGRSLIPKDQGGLDYRGEADELVREATPVWVTALDWLSVLMLTGGSLLILVLLILRVANEHSRKNGFGVPPESPR